MKRIYFLSDAHLGAKTIDNPLEHERRLVRFLDSIKHDAKAVYLMGDIIDFWYEFKTVVPRGYTRFFGKIAELTDNGVEVHWFTGNHDIWIFDYIPQELGVVVHHTPMIMNINGKKVFLAHGDGFGNDTLAYKLMSWTFRNKLCQRLFASVHPRWTVSLGNGLSRRSREGGNDAPNFLGEDKEHLVCFAKEKLQASHIDFFIFGHRHIMLDLMLSRDSRILILGDWIKLFSYAVMEGENIWLEQFEEEEAVRSTGLGGQVTVSW